MRPSLSLSDDNWQRASLEWGQRAALCRFADRAVDDVGELRPRAAPGEPDQVAEKRGVDPLAALVRRDPRELEQIVDLRLGEVERGGLLAARLRDPVARGSQ